MNRAFIFRKLCEKSDATLRDWIYSTNLEENITGSYEFKENVIQDEEQIQTGIEQDIFDNGILIVVT